MENLGVELRGVIERAGARDGGEVRIAQLQLHGAGVQRMFAQPAADHFREPRQRGFEQVDIGGVFVEGELVADGLGVAVFAHLAVKPAARVQAARFSRQRQSPLPEVLAEEVFIERRQIADLADAAGLQVFFGHFSDARNLADVERRQEPRLLARQHPQHAVRLGLVG